MDTNTDTNTPYSIAILAGGQSRRMGRNKALIDLHGKPVIRRVIDAVAPLTDDLFLVTNTPAEYRAFNLPMVSDILPGNAALGGIYTAIATAKHPWAFVLACDMPLVRADVIELLASLRADADVVVPRISPHPDTLHAFYRKTCLPAIKTRLAEKSLRVVGFFDAVRVRYVNADTIAAVSGNFNFLTNLNTPADVERVLKILKNHQN